MAAPPFLGERPRLFYCEARGSPRLYPCLLPYRSLAFKSCVHEAVLLAQADGTKILSKSIGLRGGRAAPNEREHGAALLLRDYIPGLAGAGSRQKLG